MVSANDTARLIGLDWGSTSLRAWLMDGAGQVLDERDAPRGASTLQGEAAFAAAFDEVAGAWRKADATLPAIACGMVGSTHGWLDVPYAPCPAGEAALAAGLRQVKDGPWIVPGLVCKPAGLAPDLMRGEETQIAGALHLHPHLQAGSCIVLPGTHSKWSRIDQGQVHAFSTYMTGELYAVLRQHSVLGRLMPAEARADHDAFTRGVDEALRHGELGLTHQLFGARTLGVTQRMAPEGLADYLSGLLIGHELRAGLAWRTQAGLDGVPLVLLGEPALCERYGRALRHAGAPAALVLDNVAPAGLFALARAAGLLDAG